MTDVAMRKRDGYHISGPKLAALTGMEVDADVLVFPSVTSMLKDPPPSTWYTWTVARHAVQREDEWHAVQQEEGSRGAMKHLANAPSREAAAAAEIGTAVHWMVENAWEGDLDAWLDELASRTGSRTHWDVISAVHPDPDWVLDHIRAHEDGWCEFMRESRFEPVRRELTVIDTVRRYAGTLDAVGRMGDEVVVVDYKTGSPKTDRRTGRLYEGVFLQLAAYMNADVCIDGGEYLFLDDVAGTPVRGVLVHLTPEGYTSHDVVPTPDDLAEVARRCESWYWSKSHRNR